MKLDGFGSYLKSWRETHGVSLAKLAGQAGIDRTLLNKYENDRVQVTLETVDKIVRALGDTPEQLIVSFLSDRYPGFRKVVSKKGN